MKLWNYRFVLGCFWVVETAAWFWVMSFDRKAGYIMLGYGFLCAVRGGIMKDYRRALASTDPETTSEPRFTLK